MICSVTGGYPYTPVPMSGLKAGYARCSTDMQDLTAQKDTLLGLGVAEDLERHQTPAVPSPSGGQ